MSETWRKRPELRLEMGGKTFRDWLSIRLVRSLADISGSFELEVLEQLRNQRVLSRSRVREALSVLVPPVEVRLLIDDELVLLGWLEDVDWEIDDKAVRARLAGRDRTGWLVDCSANPNGPAEYKGLTVTEIAQRLCQPFGISVRAEVDVGAPLRDFGLELGETVMSAIDKAAKQRGVLVTSDGVGGLVLTRSGTRRAPAPLRLPGNALRRNEHLSIREVYSDYYVKGQSRPDRGRRRAALDGTAAPLTSRPAEDEDTAEQSRRAVSAAPLDGTAYPIGLAPITVTATRTQRQAIISSGHAVDEGLQRRGFYRPRVYTVRSQSGDASAQVLADWRARLADARAVRSVWSVAGWRDGTENRLWRPNEVVSIEVGELKPHDELIAGVVYTQDEREGTRTELEVVGLHAFDLEPLGDQHRHHGVARGSNVANTGLGRAPGGTSRR